MTEPARTTLFRGCDWILAWDEGARSHVYLRDADLVLTGDRVAFVGRGYEGHADETVPGAGRMLLPGFVDIHGHPGHEPGWKGMLEELGSPRLGQSSLYEYMPVFQVGPEYARHARRVAAAELLRSGVTTICDLAYPSPGWVDDYEPTGIRAVLWAMFRSGPWRTRDGHSVEYDLDVARGDRALREAIEATAAISRHPSGRFTGLIAPAQIDTVSEGQIRDALDAARARGEPIQIHAAQSVVEFQEIVRRTGATPVEWLDRIGALGPDTILGHGIFLNDHPWIHYPQGDDFGRLRASGAGVAHCPVVFARRGIALNTLGRYMAAGIPCGIGTDSFPHDMLDELRLACYAGRILAGSYTAVSTRQAVTAATVGGADLLRRPDLGRLAVGAKADLSVVDMGHPAMQPDYEPLRSLVYSAGSRAIRDVYVDGRQVLRAGELVGFSIEEDVAMLRRAQAEVIAGAPSRDWAGRELEELSPRVFPVRG